VRLVRVLLAVYAGLAAVGFARPAPSAWLAQGATGIAGVLFCLTVLRVKGLSREKLVRVGGGPFFAAGALAGLGLALGLFELYLATRLRSSTALAAGPVAMLSAVLTAVSALRLSTVVPSKRTLHAVALLAFAAAAASTMLLVRSQHLLLPLPGAEIRRDVASPPSVARAVRPAQLGDDAGERLEAFGDFLEK
jgi:hypothetical protein